MQLGTKLKIASFLFVVGASAFALWKYSKERGVLVIQGPTQLLENPYPLNYPSTNPQPNKVLAVFQNGETVEFTNISYGKDFRVFEVKTADRHGYIVDGEFSVEAQ